MYVANIVGATSNEIGPFSLDADKQDSSSSTLSSDVNKLTLFSPITTFAICSFLDSLKCNQYAPRSAWEQSDQGL